MSTENNSTEQLLTQIKKSTAVLAHFSKFEQAVPGSSGKIKQAVLEINKAIEAINTAGAAESLAILGNYTIVIHPKDLRDVQVQKYCLKYLAALDAEK